MIGAELGKALRKKRIWMLVLVFALLGPLFQLIGGLVAVNLAGGTVVDQGGLVGRAVDQVASPFAMARNMLVLASNLLLVIAAVIGVFLVGEERTFKMWKTILVAQPDRLRVLVAKFASGMVIMAALVFGSLAGSVLIGGLAVLLGIASGFGGDWGQMLSVYALQWLVSAAPLMLGFLVSWVFASPAVAVIGIVILPGMVEGIVSLSIAALNLQRVSPLNAPFQALRVQELVREVPRFFFTPNVNLGNRFLGEAVNGSGVQIPVLPSLDWSQMGWSVAVCGVYFALFLGLMVWSFTSRDVHE